MSLHWYRERKVEKEWYRHLPIHLVGLTLCLTILIVTCFEKFGEGGWLTLVLTGALVAVCVYIKSHYDKVRLAIRRLDVELPDPLAAKAPSGSAPPSVRALGQDLTLDPSLPKIDPQKPVALLFVGGYGGLGRHALMTLLRMFPDHYQGVVFCSIAIVDSGNFKGAAEVAQLEARTQKELQKYVEYAAHHGLPAEAVFATGIEVAVEAERIGVELIRRFPRGLFVAGQLIFEEDSAINRMLHNETAFTIQRRLQHAGVPMIVLPVRLQLEETKPGAQRQKSSSNALAS